jgi:hypothetical protein
LHIFMIAAHNCREAHPSSAIHWKTFKTQNWIHITTAFQCINCSAIHLRTLKTEYWISANNNTLHHFQTVNYL